MDEMPCHAPSSCRAQEEATIHQTEGHGKMPDPHRGGRIGAVLKNHIRKGYRVSMTAEAARSIRDDLNLVRAMGIEIVEGAPVGFNGEAFELREVDIPFIQHIFGAVGEGKTISVVALAVQDHGSAAEGGSDRVFRFSSFRRTLEEGKGFAGFIYLHEEIPSYYQRMLSAARRTKRETGATIMVMDTALSAVLGVERGEEVQVALNIGNGHTIMALVIAGELQGLFEHHTGLLTPAKLREYVFRFPRGEVTNDEVLSDGGHGAFLLTKTDARAAITVTGPKRGMMRETGLAYDLPAPGGNMMMTGPWGLVKGARKRGLA